MRFTSVIVRNVVRQRTRSALTVVGVAVAVATVVSLVGVATNFERSFRQVFDERDVDLIVVRAGASQRLNSALDESLGQRMLEVPGVREVVPGLVDVVTFEDRGLYGVLVNGWQPGSLSQEHGFKLLSGRLLEPGDTRKVALGMILAKNLDKRVGDTVDVVEGEPFEVVGIYESFSVYENGGMVVPLHDLQALMGWEGQVTGFAIGLTKPGDQALVQEVREKIEALAPALSAMPSREQAETATPIRVARGMAWVTSLVALGIGGIGMLNTMIMSVLERTREIGILRAVGWKQGRIARMILGESFLLSLAGAIAGSLLALVAVRLLCKLPAISGYLDGYIAPQVYLQGIVVAVGLALVGGLYPALRAARLLPTEALRR
jgi:putative ABC transport system permease protein